MTDQPPLLASTVPRLTVADVLEGVRSIEALARDDEAAHAEEDRLHTTVLTAIAMGACDDPAGCARAALTTSDIAFGRWCA